MAKANVSAGVAAWIVMCFVGVMLIPITYYICIPLWLPSTFREKIQFWLGCLCYIFGGPFINIIVLTYALWNLDSFGWGKTRKVVSEDTSDDGDSHNGDSHSGDEVVEKVTDSSTPPPPATRSVEEDRVQETMDAEKRIGV